MARDVMGGFSMHRPVLAASCVVRIATGVLSFGRSEGHRAVHLGDVRGADAGSQDEDGGSVGVREHHSTQSP
jgi:hypothetical protein